MTDADLNRGALEPTPSWLKPAPAPAPVAPPAPAPVSPAPTSNWTSNITPTGTPTSSPAPAPTPVSIAANIAAQNAANAANIAETNKYFNYGPLPTTNDPAPFSNETPVTQQQLQQQAAAAEAAGTNQGGRTSAQIQAEQQAITDAARIASEKAAADKIAADKAAADKAAADKAIADSFQAKIDATNKSLDENYTKITNLIDSLAKGTIALTANQQTLIDSIQTNLVKATAAQKTANANYEAGLTQAGIAAGRNRYAPEIEMGNIYNAINVGISKINDLDAAAIAKKAELMEQFQTNNYKNALSGYKELQSILKDKEDSIIKLEQMSRDYAKEARDEEYRATKDKIDIQTKMLDQGYHKVSPNDPRLLDPDADVVVLGNDIYIRDVVSTVDPTNDIKEYEYAVNSGYNGSFMEYLKEKTNMKTPTNTVTDSEILSYAKYLQSQDYTLSDQDALNNARIILNNQQTNQGGGTTTTGVSIAERNNNPGNIKWTGADWQIALGGVDSGIKATDGGTFVKFPTVESGLQAQKSLFTGASYKNLTLDGALARWSNSGYNAKSLGLSIDPNTKVKDLSDSQLTQVFNAMNANESGNKNYGQNGDTTTPTTNYIDTLKKNQNTILASIPTTERSQFMQGLIKSASSGDKTQIKEAIYNGLVENSKQGLNLAEERNKFETVGTIESAFKEFYNKGGKTNLITGTFSNILNKLGTSKDAATQELLGKLTQIKQQYRNAITGAAWGAQEDIEYNNLLGSLTSDKTKNLSALGGAVSAAKSSYNNKLKTLTGKEVYNQFFVEPKVVTNKTEVSSMGVGEQFTYNGKTYEIIGSNSFKEIQ